MARLDDLGRRPGACAHPAQLALALLASAALSFGCRGGPPDAIEIPSVASLEAASDLLLDHVEVGDGPPDWIDHDRVAKGFIYGIGIQDGGGRRASEDLYHAMHSARRTIVVWLESRGATADEPGSLLPPVRIDPERIDFEKLARDKKANRWYALARLDIERERAAITASVATIEQRLAAAAEVIDDDDNAAARARAALTTRFDLYRRGQYARLYHALTGEAMPIGDDLDDAELGGDADEVLAQHGVRISIEGMDVPGLPEAIGAALGEVGLHTDEFGPGLVSVKLVESDAFGPGNPYLEIVGTVESAILGGSDRALGRPLRVVRTGASVEEARFGSYREINEDVGVIVREALREIGAAAYR